MRYFRLQAIEIHKTDQSKTLLPGADGCQGKYGKVEDRTFLDSDAAAFAGKV